MQKAGGKTSLCSTGGSRWPMTIQNGDVGPPKLRKSLQCVMIWGPDDVKKNSHSLVFDACVAFAINSYQSNPGSIIL